MNGLVEVQKDINENAADMKLTFSNTIKPEQVKKCAELPSLNYKKPHRAEMNISDLL